MAQIGKSEYEPTAYEWYRFLDRDRFKQYQCEADLIISHAGTGALIGALKLGKQVIAVPRLARYGEHIDDHQIQISEALESEGYLRVVMDMEQLMETIRCSMEQPIEKKYDKPSMIVPLLEQHIEAWLKKSK